MKTPITVNDVQIGGSHYVDKQIQPWEAMQAWMSPEQFEGFLRGNSIKYLARYTDKGGVYDVQKAQHYLAKLEAVLLHSARAKEPTRDAPRRGRPKGSTNRK